MAKTLPPSLPGTAILLTPRPPTSGSAIAVIRIRGSSFDNFLKSRFSAPAIPARCVHGELRDGPFVIDDCLVMLDPASAFADISLHGGAWVVQRALKLLADDGFQIIDPSLPLPAEAIDDESDPIEREVMQYLPLALTEPAIRMLLNQPVAWKNLIPQTDRRKILRNRTLWRHLHPATIAIVGEPNVGKSTLANRLFGRQRSITANLPGTTRDWVGELADIAGLAVMLIDTPGIRATEDPIEAAAIAASRQRIRKAHLQIHVLDASGDRPAAMPENKRRHLVVINKIDRPSGWNFSTLNALHISATTGEGIDGLQRAIHQRLGVEIHDRKIAWWTRNQRHRLRADLV